MRFIVIAACLFEFKIPINRDGEPIRAKKVRLKVFPGALNLVLPHDCPITV